MELKEFKKIMKQDEYFDVVDESGSVIGKAKRSECHGNPDLIHRTIHAVVFHPDGRMLLQKRSMNKDVQPGKWDTAVGGHLDSGEDFQTAVLREIKEELGLLVDFSDLEYIMDAKIRNSIESENIKVYKLIHAGPFNFQKEEIEKVEFWDMGDLEKSIESNPKAFTPNLLLELKFFLSAHALNKAHEECSMDHDL